MPVIHHGCKAHYADFLSFSFFLSLVHPPPVWAPRRTHGAPRRGSLKTHYRTLCRSFTFPSPCALADPAPSLRRVVSRPIRPIDSRPTDRTDHSIILQSAIHVPVGADLRALGIGVSRGSFDCTSVRSPVSVVNYLCPFFEPRRLCYTDIELLAIT